MNDLYKQAETIDGQSILSRYRRAEGNEREILRLWYTPFKGNKAASVKNRSNKTWVRYE